MLWDVIVREHAMALARQFGRSVAQIGMLYPAEADYSYTNTWPAEPRVDNGPTADLVVWSVLSLIALIGGTGLIFAISGRYRR